MQEHSNEEYLIMKNPLKIKFLHDPNKRERAIQTIQAIIERFNSERLGFFSVSKNLFSNESPIQQFENICIIYDIEELSKLDNVRKLKDFLIEYKGVDSYPNVSSLLKLIK